MAHAHPATCHPLGLTDDEEFDDRKLFAAECRLREFSDLAQEASRDDLATCANLFAQLLEIVRRNGENGARSTEFSAIMEFVRTRLSLLRITTEKNEPFEELDGVILEIQQRWGDYIRLLDDTPSQLLVQADSLGEADFLYGSMIAEDNVDGQYDDPESEQPTKEELELILSACEPAIEQPSPADHGQKICSAASTAESAPGIGAEQAIAVSSASVAIRPQAETISLDGELLEAYLDDARSCLASMEEAVIACESDSSDQAPLHQLCRDLHTLKGASASVGLEHLASQLHAVEDTLLSGCAEGRTPDLEAVLELIDAVRRQIDVLSDRNGIADDDTMKNDGNGSAGLCSVAPVGLNESSSSEETLRVRASQLDRLMDMLAELVMLRNRRQSRIAELDQISTQISRCVSQLRHLRGAAGAAIAAERKEQQLCRQGAANPYTEAIGKLLEAARDLRELSEPIAGENQAISQFVRQFRQELTELRRLPIVGLFRRLQRSARDAARAEGKQVQMELAGEHSGLERSLQEQLYPPLLHIVRNAVSHGIETESERLAVGKNPVGTVTIEVQGGTNLLMLVVRDDGRGLDYEAVRRRGIERGWIAADRPATRQELAQLIFRPGFSTREGSSEVSGRGVGMDVVATALERMRGWVEVESEPGQGTSVCLAVPLRGVIDHAMVFRAGGQLFAMPMSYVIRATSSAAKDSHNIRPGQKGEREPAIPFADFVSNSVQQRPTAFQKLIIGDGLAPPRRSNADQTVTHDERSRQARRLSILVDEILGPEEVVVRPLPPLLARQALFSAITLSGTGEIVFLIEGRHLLDIGLRRPCERGRSEDSQPDQHLSAETDGATYLVVDDSRSARQKLSRLLKRGGFSVDEAEDGAEALELLAQKTYDAVFTDLEMPRLNGMDLLRTIKRSPDSSAMDVVVVSSRGESEFQHVARRLGATHYLLKPVTEASLSDVLRELSQRREQATQSGGGNE
jgi:chemotaxis protein histidine kinase CheA/ActR/RegA family two-component response regulator